MTTTKFAIVFGRYQLPHIGHIALWKAAAEIGEELIIAVGSTNVPRTTKDPFTFEERRQMILDIVKTELSDHKVHVVGLPDNHSDDIWLANTQQEISKILGEDYTDKDVTLVGHERDKTSYYLHKFPQWNKVLTPAFHSDISATKLRTILFDNPLDLNYHSFEGNIANVTYNFLNKFIPSLEFKQLHAEYQHIKEYKKSWSAAPYEPTFVTTDAVVVQSGHILLIERKFEPGKGLWALPGGFIKPKEFLFDGCLRELREETRLKVPTPVLKGCLKSTNVFDDPERSSRGRTITHAFFFHLNDMDELPKVKPRDDAKAAKWIKIADFMKMQNQMFEDHYHIVCHFLGI